MSRNSEQTARVNLIINGQSANANLRDLEASARKLKSELAGLHPSDARFRQTAENYRRVNQQLQDTRVQAGLTMSAWQKMKSTITATFVGTLGSNLASLGMQQIAGYIGDAWQNAKKLSDQFADIRKTTGMTASEVLKLNSQLGKLNTRTSMSDLRDIAKVGGQFGVAKDQILGFVEAVDKTTIALGDEFSGGAEQVASEMSKLRNVLLDIKSDDVGADIGFISNAINALASDGIATGPVVSDLANRIAGYGSKVGLTTGQILGLSATMQELGITAERGGTAVVKILQKMLNNSSEFARIAGMELGEFEKLLNDDIYGAFTKVMEGSKNMGTSSTLLAGIIKDLEVEGAGASEIFAKLGSNTEMLQEKVDLAGNSLTNMNSITEEATLRNDNLAGSAERLSKVWNKFIASPAMQGFFQWFIDQTSSAIEGMQKFAEVISYNYNIITKGKAEADRIYLEAKKALDNEAISADNKAMNVRVQGYTNGLKQMTLAQLKEEQFKANALLKGDIEFAKRLNAQGKTAEAAIAIQTAKESSLQLKAVNNLLSIKENANSNMLTAKRELTTKEIKEEEKKNAAIIKQEEKHAKERKSFEDSRIAYEMELWQKQMYAEIDGMKELDQMSADMAKKEADRLVEGVNNIKKSNEEKVALAQTIGSSLESIGNSFLSRQSVIDQNEIAKEKRKNDEKRRLLKDRLDKGKISQSQYDKELEAIAKGEVAREEQIQRKAMEREKKMALFSMAIRLLVSGARALGGDPSAIAEFIATGINTGVVAATPIPEFFDGGYTGNAGGGIDGKGGFKAILHPNEYVINAKKMQDPFVYRFTEMLEGKSQKTGSNSTGSTGSMAPQVVVKSDPELIELLMELKNKGVKGVWDWDYEQRTRERMSELDNRRKL